MKLKATAMAVIRELNKHGFKAFLVGGCVRDELLGIEPSDYDITTDATPDQVIHIFPKVVRTGIRFGTVTVLTDNLSIQVTTYRREARYSDKRHPDKVSFVSVLEEDLKRRDFTINALAQDIAGRIYDPFDGQADLQRKILRAVGDPSERFREDALRVLRGVRLASRFSLQVEPVTRNAMLNEAATCQTLSVERIVSEFEKIWLQDNPLIALNLITQMELWQFLPPFSFWGDFYKNTSFNELLSIESNTVLDGFDRISWWSWLLFSQSKNNKHTILTSLRLSNRDNQEIKACLQLLAFWPSNKTDLIDALLKFGRENVLRVFAIVKDTYTTRQHIDLYWKQMQVHKLSDLSIDGRILLEELAYPKGPWVSSTLHLLLQEVAQGKLLNEKLELIKRASELVGGEDHKK